MYDCICRDCGVLLYDDELRRVTEDYGFEHNSCPRCGGWALAPCEQCIDCEEWFDSEELYNGRCMQCDTLFEEKESFEEYGGYYENGEFIKVDTYEEFHKALND